MLTLRMKQCYLLRTSFQKSTWIFVEKYKYTINFPVTNIKNENNCFVLKKLHAAKQWIWKKNIRIAHTAPGLVHLNYILSQGYCQPA